MPTELQPSSISPAMLWTGRVITTLVILFLVFDGVTKVIKVGPVMEACEKLGLSQPTAVAIGLLLLACTAVYTIPPTAVLGAILLTAYFGGAVMTHVRGGNGAFPIVFSIAFGVLTWVGLVLREPRLWWTILLRQ
jgi:hypothetical protein